MTPFRLLLVYALLDPVRATMSGLFVAAGRPEQLAWSRGVQLVVLLIGLVLLGRPFGINGVAVAVDSMLVVGLVITIIQAKAHADFSISRLFAVPSLALLAGVGGALAAVQVMCTSTSALFTCANLWISGVIKGVVFVAVFAAVSLALERDEMTRMWRMLLDLFGRGERAPI
ncbi:MAG: hypothetical protein R3C44_20040 [Chloroflexota bacterium]